MQSLEGDTIKEMIVKAFKRFKKWVEPNPDDNAFLLIFKMIYKSIVILILIALSPVILILLLIIFFATL